MCLGKHNYSYVPCNSVFLKFFTRKYIFQLTQCWHKDVSESIDYGGRNFSRSLKKKFNFFKPKYFIPEVFWKNQTYISDILTLFECILRIKIKNKCENEDNLDLFLNEPNFLRNGIIIPMLLFRRFFMQVTHQKVYLSVHERQWSWSCGVIIS